MAGSEGAGAPRLFPSVEKPVPDLEGGRPEEGLFLPARGPLLRLSRAGYAGLYTGAGPAKHLPLLGRTTEYRVATAAFWRTFSHEGKISPGW